VIASAEMTRAPLRFDWTPEDLAWVVRRHGAIYAAEHGFDRTFEEYVRGPIAEFARSTSARERLWIAERDEENAGCVAIVAAGPETAQLRWFLVDPGARGAGLGTMLLDAAVAFSRERGYTSIVLWTVSALRAASSLYCKAGFVKIEETPVRRWGVDVIEEKHRLSWTAGRNEVRAR
jgi:ribosomal protein S18 acetylase RimI-like enzyme